MTRSMKSSVRRMMIIWMYGYCAKWLASGVIYNAGPLGMCV